MNQEEYAREELYAALRDWRATVFTAEAEPTVDRLATAWDALVPFLDGTDEPERNQPRGFVLTREWQEVPAGWFVQHPKNPSVWFEVVATKREDTEDGSNQVVTLRDAEGRTVTSTRPAAGSVKVRKGTAHTSVQEALRVLGQGSHILEDQVD